MKYIVRVFKTGWLFIEMTFQSFPLMWEKFKQEKTFEKANKIDSPKSP